jgi:hypothetical protein
VRELKNCVERSFVLCDELVVLDLQPIRHASVAGTDQRECVQIPIGTTLADAEREVLLATLRHCGGNKRRTAEMLGGERQDDLQQARRRQPAQRQRRRARDSPRASASPARMPGSPMPYSPPRVYPEDRNDQEAQVRPVSSFLGEEGRRRPAGAAISAPSIHSRRQSSTSGTSSTSSIAEQTGSFRRMETGDHA